MLRVQPTELIRQEMDHYVVRCETDDGIKEFVFMVDRDAEISVIVDPDALIFVTQDDEGLLDLRTSVARFVGVETKSKAVFDLPNLDWYLTSLRYMNTEVDGANRYILTFDEGHEKIDRIFTVLWTGDQLVIRCGDQSWTVEGTSKTRSFSDLNALESNILKSVINFDRARTRQYTDEQLKVKSTKVDWNSVFLQSAKNAERCQENLGLNRKQQ